MPVHAYARIIFYHVLRFYMEAWLNIQYSIKYQYELAVQYQYQYQYGLILILNMDKNTAQGTLGIRRRDRRRDRRGKGRRRDGAEW
jgi:hypothetical protein